MREKKKKNDEGKEEDGPGRWRRWITPVGKEAETKDGNEERERSKNDWKASG